MILDRRVVEIDPRFMAAIDDLVRRGECESVDQFVHDAIGLKCQLDQVPVDGEVLGPDPLVIFFESPRGRALLRELIEEARTG